MVENTNNTANQTATVNNSVPNNKQIFIGIPTNAEAAPTVITVHPMYAALAVLRARRTRKSNPTGYFKGKRFYPDAGELALIPENVRSPSNETPYTFMKYCRTTRHIAALFGVDEGQLSALYRATFAKRTPESEPAPDSAAETEATHNEEINEADNA